MSEEDAIVEAGEGETPEGQGQFGVQKIYIKDLSFETPHSPTIFQEQWSPSVNMDVANSAATLAENTYEVTLAITVTVQFEEKTVYLCEVHQAGIFFIEGLPEDMVKRLLATGCPNILFPFAREVVADLAMRGGFPQLLLAPMNFEALYEQHLQQEAGQAAVRGDGSPPH
jgi:preprotein translocase subunit SecB